MKYLLVLIPLMLSSSITLSQELSSEEVEVKKVITTLFDAMKASDGERIRALFAEEAQMNTIGKDSEGNSVVREGSVEGFIERVKSAEPGLLDERILGYQIHIDENLASVWTPYEFYLGHEFSHCGSNSFQLHKDSSKGWEIVYIIDTRRREGCKR